ASNFRATLIAATLQDGSGNALDGDYDGVAGTDMTFDFFHLLSDANHDGKVDVADLGILASNWQQSPRTFSQGDFDYSGTVDVNDLGILASRWQLNLAPTSASFSVTSSKPSTNRIAVEVL